MGGRITVHILLKARHRADNGRADVEHNEHSKHVKKSIDLPQNCMAHLNEQQDACGDSPRDPSCEFNNT